MGDPSKKFTPLNEDLSYLQRIDAFVAHGDWIIVSKKKKKLAPNEDDGRPSYKWHDSE